MEGIKDDKKYHFAIIIELLITKNRHINLAYRLMQARDEIRLLSEVAKRAGSCLL